MLLGIAVDDYSGDAQMTASFWASRFPATLLISYKATLAEIAANEWDSVSVHARRALDSLADSGSDAE